MAGDDCSLAGAAVDDAVGLDLLRLALRLDQAVAGDA
jgi:hypothetical protein